MAADGLRHRLHLRRLGREGGAGALEARVLPHQHAYFGKAFERGRVDAEVQVLPLRDTAGGHLGLLQALLDEPCWSIACLQHASDQ